MPKILVNEENFYALLGHRFENPEALADALVCAKAELDEDSDKTLPPQERTLKIELNDTNRPDLWSTAGLVRQLKVYQGGAIPDYPFFSSPGNIKTMDSQGNPLRQVLVDGSVQGVRPFLMGFIASGKEITDAALRDIIQSQEKLAWNYGRKRRTISMGLYRIAGIEWPVRYSAVPPDSVSFIPLQWDSPLTLREILTEHPKGREYAFILENAALHPLLTDNRGRVLSYPPIINSADIGAVQVGDQDLFVELTGTDLKTLTLAASIVACDFADLGFAIDPIAVVYDYDTPMGRSIASPYYFQERIFCSLKRIEQFLGEKLDANECLEALHRMGLRAEGAVDCERGATDLTEGLRVYPPEYRNDFLHAVDVMEDVAIGRGLRSFKPARPNAFTIGRLTPITQYSRQVKELFIGMGYHEMIFNYLGSRKDLVENMRSDGSRIVRIANPMTENYEYVRDSILSSLMQSESTSGHAAYPHRIFEIGKVAYRDDQQNYGTATRQYTGFLLAGEDANFNTLAGQLQTLFYYCNRDYQVEAAEDARFIPGRSAYLLYAGKPVGIFGELHPELLERWGVTQPCAAGEIDLEALLDASLETFYSTQGE